MYTGEKENSAEREYLSPKPKALSSALITSNNISHCCHKQLAEIKLEPAENTPFGQDNFPETDSWQQLVKKEYLVDKSLLIKSLSNNTIIVRPRKWGKSTNLSMLKYFYEYPVHQNGDLDQVTLFKRRSLFIGSQQNQKEYLPKLMNKLSPQQNNQIKQELLSHKYKALDISRYWEYSQRQNQPKIKQLFGNYFVFKLQLKIPAQNYLAFCRLFCVQVLQFFEKHEYLQQKYNRLWKLSYERVQQAMIKNDFVNNFTMGQIISVLQNLGLMLDKFHKKKMIILIDEYDYIFSSTIVKSPKTQPSDDALKILHFINDFLDGFIKGGIKDYIKFVVCCGIRYILKKDQNSPACYRLSSLETAVKLSEYFGFTQDQIKEQIIKRNFKTQTSEQKDNCQVLLKTIKRLYNGYKVNSTRGNKTQQKTFINLFNPYSVTNYIQKCIEQKRIIDFCDMQDRKVISFWIQTSPSLTLLHSYINKLKIRNKEFILYIFQALLVNAKKDTQQSSLKQQKSPKKLFSFSPLQRVDHLEKRSLEQYQVYQVIDLLVETGYLTRMNDQIMIPNQEIMLFYNKTARLFLQQKLKDFDKNSTLDSQAIDIADWKQCSVIFKRGIGFLMSIFNNFCESLFTALLMARFIFSTSKYKLYYQNTIFYIRPDIVFVPQKQNQQLPIVIHQHKRLSGQYSVEAIKKKSVQAILQIFSKNYFKFVLGTASPNLKWRRLIARGVVGHYQNNRFTIQADQVLFQKDQVQSLSILSQFLFNNSSKVYSLDDMVLPRKSNRKPKNIKQFFKILLEQYNKTLSSKDIFEENAQLISYLQRILLQQAKKQHKNNSKRKRDPNFQILNLSEKTVEDLVYFLKARFSFQKIIIDSPDLRQQIGNFYEIIHGNQKQKESFISQIKQIFVCGFTKMRQEPLVLRPGKSKGRKKSVVKPRTTTRFEPELQEKPQIITQSEKRHSASRQPQVPSAIRKSARIRSNNK